MKNTFVGPTAFTGVQFLVGLAFDRSSDLLVAELKAAAPGDILKFLTNGSQTVFTSGIGQPQGNGGPEFLARWPGTAITRGFTSRGLSL
jgi:hypothetical protein